MKKIFYTYIVVLCLATPHLSHGAVSDLVWVKSLAYTNSELIVKGGLDGYVYISGGVSGTTDLDLGSDTVSVTSAGYRDAFVAKYTPSGTLVWVKTIGGTSDEAPKDIQIDSSGNVYVIMDFVGDSTVDIDPTGSTVTVVPPGGGDMLVAKLNSSGVIQWGKIFGDAAANHGFGLGLTSDGIVISGFTQGTFDLDQTAGTTTPAFNGQYDIFTVKLDTSGTFVWGNMIGGALDDRPTKLATDASDNVYLLGYFSDTMDADPGVGTTTITPVGGQDVFLLKLESDGSFAWVKTWGGDALDEGEDIAIDGSQNVYITFNAHSTSIDLDPGSGSEIVIIPASSGYAAVVKLDGTGAYLWGKTWGVSGSYTSINEIAVDTRGDVYVSIPSSSAFDADPGSSVYTVTPQANFDAYMIRLSTLGSFIQAIPIVGLGMQYSTDITTLGSYLYVVGSISGVTDFDPTEDIYSVTPSSIEYYAVKFSTPKTVYVNSDTGNDTLGDGTVAAPYKTFTEAYGAVTDGDTLDLTGTFDWSNPDETGDAVDTGFVIDKNITIQGQSASATIIQASSTEETADRSVFTIHGTTTAVITDVTIRYGVATYGIGGGGITNRGNLTLEHVHIRDNMFNGGGYGGAGGIYSGTAGETATYLTIATSTISNNTIVGSLYGSGGIFIESNNGILTITDSTISSNTAESSAPDAFPYSYAALSGAIGARVATVYLTNSTVYGNTTNSYGGALNIQLGDTTITNSTIVANSADIDAGGILVDSVELYIMNTIVANNTGDGSNDFYALDSTSGDMVVDNGYNIIEYSTNKTWSAVGDITGDQTSLGVADDLATNDSSTGVQTLALLTGSVAIHTGTTTANNSIVPPSFDQRGVARSGVIDIGAFELVIVPDVLSSTPTQSGGWSGPTYGGGGVSYIPVILMKQKAIATTSTSSLPVFTKNLYLGVVNVEVKMLQQYLNEHGFTVASKGPGSSGHETTKFGSATKAALIKFQKAKSIKPTSGYFGSLTRAHISSN